MRAAFVVAEMNFNPHECTSHFGLEPTTVRIKGEVGPRGRTPAPQSEWIVDIKNSRFDSTNLPLQHLLDVIWSKRKRIRDYIAENQLKICFVLEITGGLGKRNFLYEFSTHTLGRIAYFGAPLYLDVY